MIREEGGAGTRHVTIGLYCKMEMWSLLLNFIKNVRMQGESYKQNAVFLSTESCGCHRLNTWDASPGKSLGTETQQTQDRKTSETETGTRRKYLNHFQSCDYESHLKSC